MSAKHKRPFYVFAAVAAICGMVLVTGVRGSKADDGRAPVFSGPQIAGSGTTIEPLPEVPGSTTPDAAPGPGGLGADGDVAATPIGPDGSLTDADGGDLVSGADSGTEVLQPDDTEDVAPPVTDDETGDEADDKGRGNRDGKGKGKDKGKDKDEQGNPPGNQPDGDPEGEEAEGEADPDVYGVPEDEVDEVEDLADDVTP